MATRSRTRHNSSHRLSNIIGGICHVVFAGVLTALAAGPALPQSGLPPYFAIPRPSPSATPQAPRKFLVQPPNTVAEGDVLIEALTQYKEGPLYHLRANARVETSTALLKADEIDYNEDTGDAEARGHVYLLHFSDGEELWADHADYNVRDETGKFYNVRGSSPVHIEARPGVLTTSNPFYFQGEWAERLKEKYILHDGFTTNCKMPKPWWIERAPVFDIIPGDRALAYRSTFWLKGIPLFYSPVYYKSLARLPRKSGFLLPNIGHSSSRGEMFGLGYYWAINRSYDLMAHGQYFTSRGLASNFALRGRPDDKTVFDAVLYGVSDRLHQGGVTASVQAKSELGDGFYARLDVNYLSSLLFRQAWSESYNEAITTEVHSIGFIAKDWSSYGLDFVFQHVENFLSTTPNDTIVIQKLPQAEFTSRDHQIWQSLPIWLSWDSSFGFVGRETGTAEQNSLISPGFVNRADLYPHLTTALRFWGFSLVPSFSLRETYYGETQPSCGETQPGCSETQASSVALGRSLTRSAREFEVALVPPSFEHIYDSPGWLGKKIKHVIEPRVTYHYVGGVGGDFDRIVRFDDTELYSNTNMVEVSITNRLYAKRKDGAVDEVLSWEIAQERYFDPTFGGAIVAGQRNVVLDAIELTPYAFLDQPRNYSPVVSILQMTPRPGFSIEWRSDYDPLRGKIVDSGVSAWVAFGKYVFSAGDNTVSTNPEIRLTTPTGVPVPVLAPAADQVNFSFHVGNQTRRGWNAGFAAIYDFRAKVMPYINSQVTYNTDCCGISFQFGRFHFGARDESQFRVSFAVANIGSFGTLRKQDRLF